MAGVRSKPLRSGKYQGWFIDQPASSVISLAPVIKRRPVAWPNVSRMNTVRCVMGTSHSPK